MHKRQFFMVVARALIPAFLLSVLMGVIKEFELGNEEGLRTSLFLFPFLSAIFIIPLFRILKSLAKGNRL